MLQGLAANRQPSARSSNVPFHLLKAARSAACMWNVRAEKFLRWSSVEGRYPGNLVVDFSDEG